MIGSAVLLILAGLLLAYVRTSFDMTRPDATPADDYRPQLDRRRGERRDAAPKDLTVIERRHGRGRRKDDV